MPYLLVLPFLLTVLSFSAQAGNIAKDPLNSPMWEYLAEETFGENATIIVDENLKVFAPTNAESNFQVPVSVDASALGKVEEIVLMTDLNPFPIAVRFFPMQAKPYFATRVKLNEGSVIHAIAKTPDGIWRMNGTFVSAQGGGCTTGPQQTAQADWADHLLEAKGRMWQRGDSERIRFSLRHPMDTGLSGDVPVFIIEEINFKDANGLLLSRFELKEPISENPVLTLDFPKGTAPLRISGRDNNANEFDVKVGIR
ncbi:MAG: quinoprotein dehydrogenase-associated SoxYZ-like carrier [Terasakiella sp.]|uniref:quinoprotein dehydrogenase-associated SoxYZ-like carrier n=1 Tax=unclassified Terasakiella TaxID=2614952 RepID=UPI003B008D0B